MLFWIFVIILIVGIILTIIGNKMADKGDRHHLIYWTTGIITSIVSAITVLTTLIIICCQHIGVNAYIEKNKEIYEGLTYKVSSGACRDEFGLLSKEVIDEVQEWNKDVRYYKAVQNDFWIGIFYPNVYDQFETIDYKSYNKGE